MPETNEPIEPTEPIEPVEPIEDINEVKEELEATKEDKAIMEEELKEVREQLAAKDEEFEKLSNKDYNFKKVREENKLLKDKEKEIMDKVGEQVGSVRQEIASARIDTEIEKLSDGDTKVADKIKHFYESFKGEPKDLTEMKERISNASMLAGIGSAPSSLGSVATSSGGGRPVVSQPSPEKLTGELKAMGDKMFGLAGVTQEDLKKEGLI